MPGAYGFVEASRRYTNEPILNGDRIFYRAADAVLKLSQTPHTLLDRARLVIALWVHARAHPRNPGVFP